MNMTCEIVKDLVELYQEKIVSKESAEAIRTHLKGCPECRRYYHDYNVARNTEMAVCSPAAMGGSMSGTQARLYEQLSRKLRRRRFLQIAGTSAAIGAGSIMLAVGILLTCKFNADSLMKQ